MSSRACAPSAPGPSTSNKDPTGLLWSHWASGRWLLITLVAPFQREFLYWYPVTGWGSTARIVFPFLLATEATPCATKATPSPKANSGVCLSVKCSIIISACLLVASGLQAHDGTCKTSVGVWCELLSDLGSDTLEDAFHLRCKAYTQCHLHKVRDFILDYSPSKGVPDSVKQHKRWRQKSCSSCPLILPRFRTFDI